MVVMAGEAEICSDCEGARKPAEKVVAECRNVRLPLIASAIPQGGRGLQDSSFSEFCKLKPEISNNCVGN